ncbi:isopentenyl-diphosphate Delta-isomerase [Aestuariibius insulae]|uniref:isopentenyl-diphosphate Delta-isomerase n=1 Tax=Aestuariibius insulae TaxID=2058287 RepID=UPI00345E9414
MTSDLIPAWVDGTLMPVDKLEVHQRGLKHKAVSVFVTSGSRVLIQRRALGKYHSGGLWANTCCTHPGWDESAADCAVRRLNEELGITGLYPAWRNQVEYRADVGNGLVEHEVVELFLAQTPPTLALAPNPSEVMETRWVDFYELSAEVQRHPNRFTAWLRVYLEEHKDTIFGSFLAAGE